MYIQSKFIDNRANRTVRACVTEWHDERFVAVLSLEAMRNLSWERNRDIGKCEMLVQLSKLSSDKSAQLS